MGFTADQALLMSLERAQHRAPYPLIRQIAPTTTIALAWIQRFGSRRARPLAAL
jgi:hypothetical protein